MRFHQFKKLKDFKYQQMWTSTMNKLERLMVVAANNANMESNSGQEPYSIPATLTSDGLAPSGFTTVQGINPTTQSKWRNQTASYTAASFLDTDTGLIAGFDQIMQLLNFKKPMAVPDGEKNFTTSEFKNCVVLTNREGRRDYMKALRANNDITRTGPQDLRFDGVPVRACEG